MSSSRFSRLRPVVSGLALALPSLLAGCFYPNFGVSVRPSRVSLSPSDSVTVAVSAQPAEDSGCQDPDDPISPDLCADIPDDAELDFHVHNLPPGVTASIDTSLQSPSTPGAVLLTLSAALTAEAGTHDLSIIASVDGQRLGWTTLEVRILSTGFSTAVPEVIAAGSEHSLVILQDGTVWAWGRNFHGQLGVGDTRDRALPTAVDVPVGVAAVSALKHTLAVGVDGSVWAWGLGSQGQLGLGTRTDRLVPVRVPSLPGIDAVAAGYNFSLALGQDGTVWSWGSNRLGQLGDPSRTGPWEILFPAQIPVLTGIQAIAAAEEHALALGTNGRVWSWGSNAWGQLGDPSRTRESDGDTPAPVPGLAGVQEIAARGMYSLARLSDGSVWYWGNSPKLGLRSQATPIPVAGLSGIATFAAGGSYHALAVRDDGTVWAWGYDGSGELGNGSEVADQPVPVQVLRIAGAVSVAAGRNHSLALLDCGQVWAWGSGLFGQLGVGGFPGGLDVPTPVGGIGDDSGCPLVTLRVIETGDGAGWATSPFAARGCDLLSGSHVCSGWEAIVPQGTDVNLSAVADEGSTFGGWDLDCESDSPDQEVAVERSMICAARFDDDGTPPVLLTVNPTGGSITSSDSNVDFPMGPTRIDCGESCGALFRLGTTVNLHAAEAAGFEFLAWRGDCAGGTRDTHITVNTRSHCVAEYRPFELVVDLGPGGRVISDPPGIVCDQESCTFSPGAGQVTLTALPDPGFELLDWAGDCTGTSPQALVTMDAKQGLPGAIPRAGAGACG